MSSDNLVAQRRSAHLDRRTLVLRLAALSVPAIGITLLTNPALAGGKKAKRSRKKNGKSGVSASCGGGCR